MRVIDMLIGISIGAIITFLIDTFQGRGCRFCKYKFENKFSREYENIEEGDNNVK